MGDLQQSHNLWEDFDEELRNTARNYLGSLSTMGVHGATPQNTKADWFGMRMILGTALAQRLRENTETG